MGGESAPFLDNVQFWTEKFLERLPIVPSSMDVCPLVPHMGVCLSSSWAQDSGQQGQWRAIAGMCRLGRSCCQTEMTLVTSPPTKTCPVHWVSPDRAAASPSCPQSSLQSSPSCPQLCIPGTISGSAPAPLSRVVAMFVAAIVGTRKGPAVQEAGLLWKWDVPFSHVYCCRVHCNIVQYWVVHESDV